MHAAGSTCDDRVMSTIVTLVLLLGGVAVLLVLLIVATFVALAVGVAIGDRLHRRSADRAGFGEWLAGDRHLDDDGLLDALDTTPAVRTGVVLRGAPVVVDVTALDEPDPIEALEVVLGAETIAAEGEVRARLRVWRGPDDEGDTPAVADLVVLDLPDRTPVAVAPIGPTGWLELTAISRRLPRIHPGTDPPGLVVTDLPTMTQLDPDALYERRPSWPDPPDAARLVVPLADASGSWVQSYGRGDTVVLLDADGDPVGVAVTHGGRCRPDWR